MTVIQWRSVKIWWFASNIPGVYIVKMHYFRIIWLFWTIYLLAVFWRYKSASIPLELRSPPWQQHAWVVADTSLRVHRLPLLLQAGSESRSVGLDLSRLPPSAGQAPLAVLHSSLGLAYVQLSCVTDVGLVSVVERCDLTELKGILL